MNILLVMIIIAGVLFLLCLELTVCMIASSIYRKHREYSVQTAFENLVMQNTKPWEVDT